MKYRILNQSANGSSSLVNKDIAQEVKRGINNLKGEFYDLKTGNVNYQIIKNSNSFEDYKSITHGLISFDLTTLTGDESKSAFWINMYNAMVVHGIIELDIKTSVKEVPSFFQTVAYDIGGYTFSLDDIEHGILRGNKKKHYFSFRPFSSDNPKKEFIIEKVDPRIHFALVCGSKSCPPIGVYEEEKIKDQLNLVAAGFINSDEVIIDKERKRLKISKIFKWYEDDFGGRKQLIDFFAHYRFEQEDKDFLNQHAANLHFDYSEYDWSLNLV